MMAVQMRGVWRRKKEALQVGYCLSSLGATDDGDTVHVLTYVQQKCFCSLSLEGTLQMRFLSL